VPYAGGGFGRRTDALVATEATTLAARFPGRPVQLLWSREDDIRAGFFRAASLNRLEAVVDRSGAPTAWRHRIVTQSLGQGFGARNLPFGGDDPATDHNSVEGAVGLAYDIDNLSIELVSHASPVPIGYWRCNAHFNNALANECFLDECAAHAGQDPYQLRQRLLRERLRHRDVLDAAAERADWGSPLAAGRGRGIALHASFGSIVAVVIEASVEGGELAVERAVVAIDCGVAVNPDSITAQAEGSVVWALSAALLGEITLADGQIEQSNFHDYRVLRICQAPRTETVIIEGDDRPGGVGEPIVPPVAPALLNAVFAATGRRLRRLPIAEPAGRSGNRLRLRDYPEA
jgi:isoquinoline 1-oxidoreductase beta subunit